MSSTSIDTAEETRDAWIMQYGPPPQGPHGYGPPPQHQGYGSPAIVQQQIVVITPKSTGVAVALELLPGFFFQWFGWGNIYAGHVGTGIAIMLSYWALTAVNVALCFVFIGFITWPLTWLLFAVVSSILASNAVAAANHATTQSFARR